MENAIRSGSPMDSQASALNLEDTVTLISPSSQADVENEKASNYLNAAHGFLMECKAAGNISDLEKAIYLIQYAAHKFPATDPRRKECQNYLASAFLTRFGCTGEAEDVHKAFFLRASTLGLSYGNLSRMLGLYHESLFPETEFGVSIEDAPDEILAFALDLLTQFHQAVDQETLKNVIALYQKALSLQAPSKQQQWRSLLELSEAILMRFHCGGDTAQVNEAVACMQQGILMQSNLSVCLCAALLAQANALGFEGVEHSLMEQAAKVLEKAVESDQRAFELVLVADEHYKAFQESGDIQDIDAAVENLQQATLLLSWGHALQGGVLGQLALMLHTRYEETGNSNDLAETIKFGREVLALHPALHPERGPALNNLANAVLTQYQQNGDYKDLEEAIELHRGALALRPSPHPDRVGSLINLSSAVQTQYKQKGNFQDLEESIKLLREALALCPAAHPDLSTALNNLASAVRTRFEQKGDFKDLEEAIELLRRALELRPASHPTSGSSLNNLANALLTQYQQKGDFSDLEEAIKLYRGVLAVWPAPHPHHSISLNNLATAIQTRFEQKGDFNDLEEAIELHRGALALRPTPHPDRDSSLSNLSVAVQLRYKQKGYFRDLEEAIELHREALALRPTPHPNRGVSLNNLANAVQTRHEQKRDLKDIVEAIELHREALTLRPAPHPDYGLSLNDLASALQAQYKLRKNFKDLEEAITLCETAVETWASPHPDRGYALTNLAHLLVIKYENTQINDDLNASMSAFQKASAYMFSSPLNRLHHTHAWAKTAAQQGHSSALPAYHATVDLLPQITALHLDVVSRQSILTTLQGSQLVSGAAACAVAQGEYNVAVELLEASRSIFWSQALCLRTPLHQLEATDPGLALQLRRLAKELELASFRDTTRNLRTDSQDKAIAMEAAGTQFRHLNDEWDATLRSVRLLPGFEHFMGPQEIAVLQQAAKSGPVIILISQDTACFALIVTFSEPVQCVHLPAISGLTVDFQANLSRALSRSDFDVEKFLGASARGKDSVDLEMQARLYGGHEGRVNMSPTKVFRGFLADLWKSLVKPIFDALNLKKSDNPPRLWWCPTGVLTFLPIHAAGLYALLDPPIHAADPFKMTTIIQPYTEGYSPLPGCRAELENIVAKVPNQWLTTFGDTTEATVQTALSHLRLSSVVHFACHGTQDLVQPLESGLIVSDGRVKVSEIMRRPEDNAAENINKSLSLAFLSACETAKGDASTPDEAMHLAATLLFVGFRSVVGTMWRMEDADGPKIADKFYERLFKGCDPKSNPPILPDLSKSAEALHYAVAELRKESGISFKRWVPFVHYVCMPSLAEIKGIIMWLRAPKDDRHTMLVRFIATS
ncbi:CHAT domain-containing protein [Mycena pura]|uniref:CHAT domain-containing protein n=1 Tax=Mycena pura TaxID=153505 RepID=A0AAD6V176_9AGAR|nr:CHAT domain-containing protein [Mycena pura]